MVSCFEFRLREGTAQRTFGFCIDPAAHGRVPYRQEFGMNTGVRHVSKSPRRTVVAHAFALTITVAFATVSVLAIITASLPPTGAQIFVPSGQEVTPCSASQVRGCVLQDPNGYGRGWVPGASAMTGAGAQEHTSFSRTSLCVNQLPVGPGAVWVPHLPGTVVSP
jgi:hypothetical protein